MLDRSGWLVGGDDDTGARRRGAGEPQGGRLRAVAEQFLAGAEVNGKEEQAVFVDEVVFDERLGERAAAVYLQLVSRLLLELGDFGRDVAARLRGSVTLTDAAGPA